MHSIGKKKSQKKIRIRLSSPKGVFRSGRYRPGIIRHNPENYIKFHKNIIRLNKIALLESDWNMNGADPFSEKLIDKTKIILRLLAIQPMIFPTANDSIQLEYEKSNGEYLEFEVFEDQISMLKINEDRSEEFLENIDILLLNRQVRKFYQCLPRVRPPL